MDTITARVQGGLRRSRVRRGARQLAALLLIGWLNAPLLAGVAHAAQTWYVAPDGNDRNSCRSATAPCRSIRKAIERAESGDTIKVAAGKYAGSLRIEKSLRLLGAQAEVSAVGRASPESIIAPGKDERIGVTILADGVVLDGFTIESSPKRSGDTSERAGVELSDNGNKPQRAVAVRNSRIIGATRAIDIGSVSELQISGNLLQGLLYGVYLGGASVATTISGNSFAAQSQAAISFGDGPHRDAQIDRNQLREGAAIVLRNTTAATITNNSSSAASGAAVQLGGGNQDVLIGNNVLMGGVASAVLVTSQGSATPNRDVRLVRNTLTQNSYGLRIDPGGYLGVLELHFNRIAANTSAGLSNESTATVNAENNWWGCSAGPGQTGCDSARGAVDVAPWLVLRARFAPLLHTGSQATLSADLTFNSDGVSTAAAGTLPDRTPASFGGSLGTVSPAIAGTLNGVASAVYTAGSRPGSERLTVSVDYQPLAQEVPLRIGRFLPLLAR